jgi:hypothetical protein
MSLPSKVITTGGEKMANDRVSKALGDVISALTELKEAWDEQMASYTPQVIITDGTPEDLSNISQVDPNCAQSEDPSNISQVDSNSDQSEDPSNISQVDLNSAQSENLKNIQPENSVSENVHIAVESVAASVIAGVSEQAVPETEQNIPEAAPKVKAEHAPAFQAEQENTPEAQSASGPVPAFTVQTSMEPVIMQGAPGAMVMEVTSKVASISGEQVASSTPAASAASSVSATAGVQGASDTSIPSYAQATSSASYEQPASSASYTQPASSASVAQGQPKNAGGRVCPLCGTPAAENSKFCLMCGANIPVQPQAQDQPAKMQAPAASFCHKCGAEILPGDRFCIGCGTPV